MTGVPLTGVRPMILLDTSVVKMYIDVVGDEIVHLRIPAKVYKVLQKKAEDEKRSLANMLRYILIRYAETCNENTSR